MRALSTRPRATATLACMTAARTEEHDGAQSVAHGLERYRALRHQLESAVLPLATSLDGRRFTFQASLHGLELQLGGYVVMEHAGHRSLGQVLDLELHHVPGAELDIPASEDDDVSLRAGITLRIARGSGALLEGDEVPFHDATLRAATPEEVLAWTQRRPTGRANLGVGELVRAPGVPCEFDAGGFDRHTFLCGQSGSGKTYSLGVVLERLLLETGLRIVVLDPNSDFARLATVREGTDPALAERYRAATSGLAVHTARVDGEHRLRFRLAEIGPVAQAALLRLDPIADREEHAALTQLLADGVLPTAEAIAESERPGTRELMLRARNLGIERYAVWAREQPGSTLDALQDESTRGVVVDLGSLSSPEEQALAAEAVLGELWRLREARRPVLIVIDEAHNVCPAMPGDAITALATSHAVRIAAEGRKFGLYMLVSTQRPQKVHENVLTQCDNLLLMRLNSAADAAFAQEVFSFVPERLIGLASAFRLGEALVAGKLSPQPALLRFGARISEEGGSDVPTTWAATA
jgi:DNA helicase HerA-like ATPase